jgi:hypothetical protein
MLHGVIVVRTDVSKELSASIIRVTRISSPILITLMMEAINSSETSVLTRGTRRNIPEDAILQEILEFSVLFYTREATIQSK